MLRQQTPQHPLEGGAADPSVPSARHDRAHNAATHLGAHNKVLEYVGGALDVSMLESKHVAVAHCEPAFHDILQDEDCVLMLAHDTPFLQLCTRAAVNCMNVTLQDIRRPLLHHGKLPDIVGSLCCLMSCFLTQINKLETQGRLEKGRVEAFQQIAAIGLPAALSRFSVATWQALQQLDISSNQQHRGQQEHAKPRPAVKQQRDDFVVRCVSAALLIAELVLLWGRISACPGLCIDQETLAVLIALTTTAPQLLKQARTSFSISSRGKLAAFDDARSLIASSAGATAAFVALHMDHLRSQAPTEEQHRQQQEQTGDDQQQQQQQHVYLTEKLPEVLLQLLASQAGRLHTARGGVSQAMQDRNATAATTNTGLQQEQGQEQQQQQQQQQHIFGGCLVPSSHIMLLQSVGSTGYQDDEQSEGLYDVTVAALHSFVVARCKATQLNSTRGLSGQNAGPQWQHQVGNALPSHLLIPAVKVLIEIVLLLPPGNSLSVHAGSLQLSLMLLQTAVGPVSVAAPAVRESDVLQVSPSSAPWPKLPAAVAAGLLQPVVAQLSQAVMYCLLQTDYQQGQEMKADRLMLLHSYGSVLITVCQSVQPKHIAAVLKSQSTPELLITLAAFEAVIRAQACHLAPRQWRQQSLKQMQQKKQKQQQQEPDDFSTSNAEQTGSNNRSFDLLQDITYHQLELAPTFLLPFVTTVVLAVEDVLPALQQQQQLATLVLSTLSSVDGKLSARLFTLLGTALKVSRRAATAAAAFAPVDPAAPAAAAAAVATMRGEGRLLEGAMGIPLAISHMMQRAASVVQDTPGSLHYSGHQSTAPGMPLSLSFQALGAWACGWSAFVASHKVPVSVAQPTATAVDPTSQDTSASSPILQVLVGGSISLAMLCMCFAKWQQSHKTKDNTTAVSVVSCNSWCIMLMMQSSSVMQR